MTNASKQQSRSAVADVDWIDANAASARELRHAFGTFLTGVTIVTFVDRMGEKRGFTANSFTSVSLDPPLVLVCVGGGTASHDPICNGDRFAINILAEGQEAFAQAFGSRDGNKYLAVPTFHGDGGLPIVEGCASALDCTLESTISAGDHTIVIGRVNAFYHTERNPLGFHRGKFTMAQANALAATQG